MLKIVIIAYYILYKLSKNIYNRIFILLKLNFLIPNFIKINQLMNYLTS